MRKFTTILAVLFYLIPTLGFSVTSHYCGGKLPSVSFDLSKDKTCACGSKKAMNNCCKNTTCVFKTSNDSHQAEYFNLDFQKDFEFDAPEITLSLLSVGFFATNTIAYSGSTSPPPAKEPLFLQNRVFRI